MSQSMARFVATDRRHGPNRAVLWLQVMSWGVPRDWIRLWLLRRGEVDCRDVNAFKSFKKCSVWLCPFGAPVLVGVLVRNPPRTNVSIIIASVSEAALGLSSTRKISFTTLRCCGASARYTSLRPLVQGLPVIQRLNVGL